jgi:hypothetical protein
MYLNIFFFYNFFLLIIIKLFSLYYFNNNNKLNYYFNKVKIIYYYLFNNLLKTKKLLSNYKNSLFIYRFKFKKIKLLNDYKFIKENFYVNYSNKFFFNLKNYKKYLFYLNNLYNFNIKKYIYDKKLIESPISTKKARMKFFLKYNRLYGYKFHFTGRFTRKQKSANLWFSKGYLEISSAISKIDYSFVSIVLRFSVCSIKV